MQVVIGLMFVVIIESLLHLYSVKNYKHDEGCSVLSEQYDLCVGESLQNLYASLITACCGTFYFHQINAAPAIWVLPLAVFW